MPEPQVLLNIVGNGGPRSFPAILMPKDYAAVSGVPFDRIGDITKGQVVITPPPGSGLIKQSASVAGMRVFPSSNGATATVAVKLGLSVATVSMAITGDDFHRLVGENNQNVVAALAAGGTTAQLKPQPWQAPAGHQADRPQPIYGWIPFTPPGYGYGYGFCCWCYICQCH